MVDPLPHPGESPDDGAPAFEITPAMIAAGTEAYSRLDREFDADDRIVMDVFLAMAAAAPLPMRVTVSRRLSAHRSHWWLP
jgi:hypothetical protein